jgi:hypothetical protein
MLLVVEILVLQQVTGLELQTADTELLERLI